MFPARRRGLKLSYSIPVGGATKELETQKKAHACYAQASR